MKTKLAVNRLKNNLLRGALTLQIAQKRACWRRCLFLNFWKDLGISKIIFWARPGLLPHERSRRDEVENKSRGACCSRGRQPPGLTRVDSRNERVIELFWEAIAPLLDESLAQLGETDPPLLKSESVAVSTESNPFVGPKRLP